MAFPGNDNTEETLLWKLIVRTEEAIKGVEDFRKRVDELKAELKSISAESGESFKTVAASIRKEFRDSIDASRKSIADLRNEIRNLKDIQKAGGLDIAGVVGEPGTIFSTDAIKTKIAEANKEIRVHQQELAKTRTSYNEFQRTATTALRELTAEEKQAAQGAKSFGFDLSNLNNIARIVFGVTLLSLAGQALRSLIGWMKEASQDAYNFAQAMFQLEVGVRALRRAGIDVTTSEVLDNLQKINKETGNLFSQLELVQGAADFTNLIRDLGLTRDEIFKLQGAIVQLAIINGRSLADVQRTVALALSSGYTEGLQRLGVSINRLTIAEEANREGFKGGYTALTEQARSQATYNLLLQKTTKYADDLSEAQKRVFGQIQGSRAEVENISVAIGEAWLPVQLLLNKALLAFLKLLNTDSIFGFARSINALGKAAGALPAIWEQAGKGTDSFGEKLKEIGRFWVELNQAFKNNTSIEEVIAKFAGFGQNEINLGTPEFNTDFTKLTDLLDNYGDDITNLEQEIADKRKKINDDLQKDLAKIEKDGIQDRFEITRDYLRDLDKINRDAADKLVDLSKGLQERLNNIDIKLNFDIQEAKIKFDFDVNETFVKFNQEVAKANEDFRNKEIKRERDYQEKLKQLREDYLLTLEDALEQRDARAVLRARREFIVERDRAARANEINKEENKTALEQDIEAAKQRREERLRQLKLELEQRIAELNRQAQFEREQAQRNYEQDRLDAIAAAEQKRLDLKAKYDQELRDQIESETAKRTDAQADAAAKLTDLENYEKEKIKLLGESIKKEAELAQLGSDAVLRVIRAYFGDGGYALQIFQAYLNAIEEMIRKFNGSFSGVDPGKFNLPFGPPTPPGFASGGGAVATKPTTVQFGEVPELALFAPLNQLDKLAGLFGNIGGRNGANGKTQIKIDLAPGLVADIIDQSVDATAEIIVENNRRW